MIFGFPDEVEEFFMTGFLLLVIISILINIYMSGGCSIKLIEDEFGILPFDESNKINPYVNPTYYNLQAQVDAFKTNKKRAFWFSTILYWIGIPFMCFYFAIFKFKNLKWGGVNIFTFVKEYRSSLKE